MPYWPCLESAEAAFASFNRFKTTQKSPKNLALMASMEDPTPLILERSTRSTRGKRMSKIMGEELEHDEQFWGQDAFREEDNDDDYYEEGEAVDEFDSDFDDDEPEQDEETQDEEERRPVKKKKLLFGKPLVKKAPKKSKTSTDRPPKSVEDSKVSETKTQDAVVDAEGERTIRKSTRTAVIVRQAERDLLRASQSSTKEKGKRKKEEERRMTQEEMLLEAAKTEITNLKNLERMLAHEEEVKKKAVVHKPVYDGPVICFCSGGGKNILEFTKGSFPAGFFKQSQPYPEKPVCVITGQPAKYRDPKSGLPYATKEAFKIIRDSLSEMSKDSRRDNSTNMGSLFRALSERGFKKKRKRSAAARTKPHSARAITANSQLPSGDQLVHPLSIDRKELTNASFHDKHDTNTKFQYGRISPSLSSQLYGDDSSLDDTTLDSRNPNEMVPQIAFIHQARRLVPSASLESTSWELETQEEPHFSEGLDLHLRIGSGFK
eukprot:TRINITY_DN17945_c0_g2_i1.p1 TRINITY_DN17945_c0_g2~~TRINITY_DN17945_c0_g2_i1.p1  ORF type:complete len:491 (-),score=144.70 TRINITY_DN17945_c0_g2_i1:314-1786(-)